jgi:phosphocarrier protein HPr
MASAGNPMDSRDCSAESSLERTLSIVNKRGLHARASAKFVHTVERFDADVRVSKDGMTVGGSSIMGLMMLAASPGCTIHVSVSGPDAEAALDALDDLVRDRFGEEA